jgi:hypothetical protein
MALRKETRLTERFGLKYELDAFNVFNHVSFAAPRNNASFYNTTSINQNQPVVIGLPVTSGQTTNVGSLGIIQSTIGSPRFLQMSVHLTF